MNDMPRPRPPYLVREVTRHGAVIWYVRKGRGKRFRIHAAYGTPEFMAEYEAALLGKPHKAKSRIPAGSLAWLWERYLDSLAFGQFSKATKSKKKNAMKRILASVPDATIAEVTSKAVKAGIDKRRDHPNVAREFLETLRGMFQWAVEAELVKSDPTAGIKTPRDKDTTGYHVWTEAECQQFEACWPRGTWQRLAFDLLLYTGLRRGDVVKVGRQHIRDGLLVIKTEKTGEEAFIPILPPLAEAIANGPTGDLTFITGKRGRNMTKESFGNQFGKACRKAGVPGSAHGLRKAMANRVAHWLTEAELEAIFAWERGSRVSTIYTQQVVRERLAKSAAKKLVT